MELLVWGQSLLGGVLVGLAAALLLHGQGRIAGISGIVGGLVNPVRGEIAWRIAFVVGLLAGGAVAYTVAPATFSLRGAPDLAWLVPAGLLVGIGTRLGNGCTSGHGVCGVGRLAPRSLLATATFLAVGVVTVSLVRILGGAP